MIFTCEICDRSFRSELECSSCEQRGLSAVRLLRGTIFREDGIFACLSYKISGHGFECRCLYVDEVKSEVMNGSYYYDDTTKLFKPSTSNKIFKILKSAVSSLGVVVKVWSDYTNTCKVA